VSGSGKPRLVIHSGTFKTGTSAIQLYLNRAQHHGLLAQCGAAYPAIGRTTGVQHGNLVAELRGDRVFTPANGGWQALLSQVAESGTPTTIVSSESFSRLDAMQLADLGARCRRAGVAVTWVHYVRDQPSFHNAFYVERMVTIRGDLVEVINKPFEDFESWSPVDLGFLRYATFVDMVRTNVAGAEIVLRPFDREHLHGGDAVQDFCHTVGLPFDAAHTDTTNVGVGWRTVETARRLYPVVREFDVAAHVRHAPNRAIARERWFQLIRSELVAASSAVGWNDESAVYLTAEHRQRLLESYHQENARLDRMVDFPWLQMVESAVPRPYNVGDFATTSADELFAVLARVLGVVHQMPAEVQALIEQAAPPSRTQPERSLSRRMAAVYRRIQR
jgi:hypothetical protein